MDSKPEQHRVIGTARPVRVAYLVDTNDCPDPLLDAIFAESYGRWGGRRTLIIPSSRDGIDVRYADWLQCFDADIIYSFVDLGDNAVSALHERHAPAHLVRHREWRAATEKRSFRIQLPLAGLSSLSVVPAFVSRSWGFDGPPRNVKLLSKFWDRSVSPFLQENFGFLSSSFQNSAVGSAHPDLYSCLTLITDEALADPRLGKDALASYVTGEDQVIAKLGSSGGPLTLAQLSEFFAPYLAPGTSAGSEGTCIVVGDTPSDRLLFWNLHHTFERTSFSEITTLRMPTARISDDAFLAGIKQLIQRRGAKGYNGRNDHVSLHSCSLTREELDGLASRLRGGKTWLAVSVAKHNDHSAAVPRFRDPAYVQFRTGGIFTEPRAEGKAEFNGRRVVLPLVMPWHMKEALPPVGLRNGHWLLDLTIDRLDDHCRFSYERHVWRLPRRLRIERAFTLEKDGSQDHETDSRFIRVLRAGHLAIPLKTTETRAVMRTPVDAEAFSVGICNNFEWLPFDRDRKDAPRGHDRFAAAEFSDKGRYLIGVLQLFESLPDVFAVLMHGFWHDALRYLGGVTAEKEAEKRDELIRILRKRSGRPSGPLIFESDEEVDRLAREAMRAGRMIGRERRFLSYQNLLKRWDTLVTNFIAVHQSTEAGDRDEDIRDVRRLDQSIQYLCQCEVLFQGREWRCESCFNRNWAGIDELTETMTCAVCRHEEPAPVSGDWQFRGNPFILEAYRDHGTEAVIWALWRLSEQAQDSFYFSPSMKFWVEYPKSRRADCDVEVHAIVVSDGTVYLIEAKSTAGLDDREIGKLALAAERIRPDVLLVACMDGPGPRLDRAIEKLKIALPMGVSVEVWTFEPERLDRSPYMPGG